MRVDRASDSRFERTVLLGFLDRPVALEDSVERHEDEMKYLHQHLFWRISKLSGCDGALPYEGEELLIRIPPDSIYLVSR